MSPPPKLSAPGQGAPPVPGEQPMSPRPGASSSRGHKEAQDAGGHADRTDCRLGRPRWVAAHPLGLYPPLSRPPPRGLTALGLPRQLLLHAAAPELLCVLPGRERRTARLGPGAEGGGAELGVRTRLPGASECRQAAATPPEPSPLLGSWVSCGRNCSDLPTAPHPGPDCGSLLGLPRPAHGPAVRSHLGLRRSLWACLLCELSQPPGSGCTTSCRPLAHDSGAWSGALRR